MGSDQDGRAAAHVAKTFLAAVESSSNAEPVSTVYAAVKALGVALASYRAQRRIKSVALVFTLGGVRVDGGLIRVMDASGLLDELADLFGDQTLVLSDVGETELRLLIRRLTRLLADQESLDLGGVPGVCVSDAEDLAPPSTPDGAAHVAVTAPPPLARERANPEGIHESDSGPHTKPPPPEWSELIADEDKKNSTVL
jgi:hypothetical protein